MKLQLYYPVKGWLVTQNFGDISNLQYYKDNGIDFKGHNGIDVIAFHGVPVYAAHDGVGYSQTDDKQGHGVVILSDKKFDYRGSQAYFKTIYWHLIDNVPIKYGQQVKAGDLIGYADSTGLSTGDHLHFGLKPLNDSMQNLEPDNGFTGAIDPNPYFNKLYAQDIGKTVSTFFSTNLQKGDTGEEVKKLQKFLANYNYLFKSEIMGTYGPRTMSAVLRFQIDFGVPLTWTERYVSQGRYWGEKTRRVANGLLT